MTSPPGTTIDDLYAFLERARGEASLSRRTVEAYRLTVGAFQRVLALPPTVDLRHLDRDDTIARFHAATAGRFTNASRTTYNSRFKSAITTFLRWVDAGSSWDVVTARRHAGSAIATHETYRFPLRPTESVNLRLPRDLTKTEARRLAAFITTLAMAAEPTDQALSPES